MKLSEIVRLAELLKTNQRDSAGEAARPKYSGKVDCRAAYRKDNPGSRKPVNYASPNKVGF